MVHSFQIKGQDSSTLLALPLLGQISTWLLQQLQTLVMTQNYSWSFRDSIYSIWHLRALEEDIAEMDMSGMSLEFRGMVNKYWWVLIVWHVNIKIIDILQRICGRDVADFWHLYGESATTMPQIFHFVLEKMTDPWLRFQPIGNMQQLFLRILNILKF
jgi:hypothetical protein